MISRWLVRGKKRYFTEEGIAHRSSKDTRGIFTVQYPEEKLPVPEEFRYMPFLVYDERRGRQEGDPLHLLRHLRQGLPAAVHLDRAHQRPADGPPGPRAGRVLHRRGHLHELRLLRRILSLRCDQDGSRLTRSPRISRNVFNMEKLLKPASYYESIRPVNYDRNEEERKAKEAAKAAKAASAAAAAGRNCNVSESPKVAALIRASEAISLIVCEIASSLHSSQ